MEIKKITEEKTPVDISEWNSEVKAFVKPLDVYQRLIFLDQFGQFYDKSLSAEERAEAGLNACIMALVGEDGNPLLTIEQMDELKKASFDPVWRIMNILITPTNKRNDTLKNE